MTTFRAIVQTASISIALVGAGGIAGLSLFDVPELQAQPADRSLPSLRWLYSRGSHIFPSAAVIAASGFAYLAYDSLPQHARSVARLLTANNGFKVSGFLAAAVLAFSIGPFTRFVMVPNNFALIKMNEQLGGARSAASAETQLSQGSRIGHDSAEDSVNNKKGVPEYSDLSIPQTKTQRSSSEVQDREVKERLATFGRQNFARAILLGAGGVLGLLTALL